MPGGASIGPAFAYYMIIGVLAAGVNLFWGSVFKFASISALLGMPEAGAMGSIVNFLLSPLLLVATLYLVTGITHLILTMMDAGNNGFNTTLRVFTYSYSPALFCVFPIVGNIVALVWMSVLSIIGLREAQGTTSGRTATAVLLPCGCLVLLVFLAGILAVLLGVAGANL